MDDHNFIGPNLIQALSTRGHSYTMLATVLLRGHIGSGLTGLILTQSLQTIGIFHRALCRHGPIYTHMVVARYSYGTI